MIGHLLLGLTSPVGLAIAGPVSDWLGLQVWYWVAGVLCSGAGILFLFTPAVLEIENGSDPELEPGTSGSGARDVAVVTERASI